jgi:PAS domain S-box-containing protein
MIMMSEAIAIHPGLEALADGFFMLDPDRRVVYWNGAATRLLKVQREDVLGRAFEDAVPLLAKCLAGPELHRVLTERVATEFVIPHLPGCCNGFYSVRAAPLDEGGVAVQLRDVTDQAKLAERYAQLLESIRDGFVAVDADGSISYINRVAERLLRLPRSRTLGTRVWKLLPEEPSEITASLRATLEDGVPRSLRRIRPEAPVLRNHFFDLWIHPLPGGGVSVLFRDVTRRLKRERDFARYAAEADEANRAKARFFAAVSHELRTPLNAIVGYTHLLTTHTYGDLPPSAVRAASRASVCAEHLAHLVDDLLLMTTAEIDRIPVATSPVSLAGFLPVAVEPIRQQAEAKGLRFRIGVAPDIPVIQSDPERLRQLLHALLSNAIKFTPRGEVAVDVVPLVSPGAAGQNGLQTGDTALDGSGSVPLRGVRIRVLDTGPGVPQAERERIFEAFEQLGDPSRTDSLQRGPGLGLTVARRIAALLGGSLVLHETGERGSVFCIDLPLRMPA